MVVSHQRHDNREASLFKGALDSIELRTVVIKQEIEAKELSDVELDQFV